jgi:hypothetical protein
VPTRRSTCRTIVVQRTTVFTSNKGFRAHLPLDVRDELIEGCIQDGVKFVFQKLGHVTRGILHVDVNVDAAMALNFVSVRTIKEGSSPPAAPRDMEELRTQGTCTSFCPAPSTHLGNPADGSPGREETGVTLSRCPRCPPPPGLESDRSSLFYCRTLFTNVVLSITLPVSYEYIPTAKMIVIHINFSST